MPVDMPPEETLDHLLARDVEDELPADFALRVERRAEIPPSEPADSGAFVWFGAMTVLVAVFTALHALFAFDTYRSVWSDLGAMAAGIRLDLILWMVAVFAALQFLGRRRVDDRRRAVED